jgi:hypothetical protein
MRWKTIRLQDFVCLAIALGLVAMVSALRAMLPRNKLDTERAKAIVSLGFPAAEPILPELLEWVQDGNWPVAQVFFPFLAEIGGHLAPHLRKVLETRDESWKWFVMGQIVASSKELASILRPELMRIATSPSVGEKAEGLDSLAKEILQA